MIAGPTAFSVRHGRSLVQAGLSPDLLALAARVSTALPRRIGAAPLRDFLLRHHVPLQAMLEDAFRSVPPAGHPLDVNPPRVGPIHRSMTLEEAEAAIRGEAEEYVVLFDADGQQVARFGPEGTWGGGYEARSQTLLDSRLRASVGLPRWTLTHNHPGCGVLSPPDLITAVSLNLQEIRAVCADGWTWWMRRPTQGWPSLYAIVQVTEGAAEVVERRWCNRERREDKDAWIKNFNEAFAEAFNRQGRDLGLHMHGGREPGPGDRRAHR